jgi:transglutaminase-like putative cysteine protease
MTMRLVPTLDLLVRVGCRLTYTASAPATVVLKLKPRMDPGQIVQQERVGLGDRLPCDEYEDAYGNISYRLTLRPGINEFSHDAVILVPSVADNFNQGFDQPEGPGALPVEILRYTLPSRYCDSDKLMEFAWREFGSVMPGHAQVRAVSNWIHQNIEYRFGSGRADISAAEIIARRHGVCRDFAHCGIALCRALNLPARYVTGHLPDIGYVDPGSPMDFHAYFEVYLDGKWFAYDPRYNVPRIGRVKVACGLDAVDCAFATIYGPVTLSYFEVWAYQVPPNAVSVGDPIDLSKRLDGSVNVRYA